MARKILIVDDLAINRKLLCKILGDEYEVWEAENGKDALDLLQRMYAQFAVVLLDIAMPVMDGYTLLERIQENPAFAQLPVIVTTASEGGDAEMRALTLGANDFLMKPYNPGIIRRRVGNVIKLRETAATVNELKRDRLTGLLTREAFFREAAERIDAHPPGYYIMACFDIDNFKVINDQYGNETGDRVLCGVASIFREGFSVVDGIVSRISADNYAVLYPASFAASDEIKRIRSAACTLDGTLPSIAFSIGRYLVTDLSLSVSAMYDRAAIAEASIKGRFDTDIALYDESMRVHLLREQEIVNEMKAALATRQFEVWLQPQYNHSSGALIGAEALVRWRHPKRGMVMPNDFIPVFERNGFIYELDKFVWEESCRFLRNWFNEGRSPLSISVNVSRYDLFCEDLVEVITGLVDKYDIPIALLRLEITESAFAKSTDRVISVVKRLVALGFTLEIDDFGSGYSSLNTLKDVPAQIVKLDMRFLEGSGNSDRGGNILESIVRMTKWLGMSVIAEGVEDRAQADYLKSIGCNYVQGYLYAKPMPVADYDALAKRTSKEEKLVALETVENLDNNSFWDPKSMDTLIFNTYVGGACIFEWKNGHIELLRANEKYAKTIGGTSCTVEDVLNLKWEEHMDARVARLTRDAIECTIATGDDVTYEAAYTDLLGNVGKTYLRTTFRAIARTEDRYLLYATNENLTAQRKAEEEAQAIYERMQTVMDNVGSGISATVVNGEAIDYLFVNDRYFEMHGFTRAQYEAEVESAFVLIHPDDRQWMFDAVQKASEVGLTTTLEYRVIRRDKKIIWIRIIISTRLFEGVDAPVQFSVYTDITAEKEATQRIRSLNDNLQNMMDDTPGGFVRLSRRPDGSYRIEHANDSYCRLRGMTYEAIVHADRKDILDAIHPDDRAAIQAAIAEMRVNDRSRSTQCRLRHTDGSYIPVTIFARVAENEAGEQFINVYFAELSEQEKRDFSLRETIPYVLTAIMQYSTDLVFAKDKDFRYICCSPAFVQFANQKSESDVIGGTDYDFFPRETADNFRNDDRRLFENGEPLINYIEPIPSDDGVQHYCSTSKYLLRDAAGAIIGMYGTARDVTQERNAFEQLRLLTNSIPGGLATYEVSPAGIRITYFNDGFCRMMGYSREEYVKMSDKDIMGITFREDVPGVMAQLQAMMQDGTPVNCTYRIHTKDGGYKWVNLRGNLSERRGDRAFVNVVLFDVTESTLAQKNAIVHEQEMRLAMSQLGKMICEYDPVARTLTVPESYAALYGMPAVVTDMPERLIATGTIDPTTIPAYRAFYDAILRGDKSGAAEFRSRSACGNYFWNRVEFSLIFDFEGKPVKAVIAVEDTTEQHRQYELEQSRPTLGEENLLVHALFNLHTGETLDYAYRDGREVPREERTAFLYGGDNLDSIIINSEERARYRAMNDPAQLLKHYEEGETELTIDYRRQLPEGEVAWVRNILHMVTEPGGSDVLLFEYCYLVEEEKTKELMYRALVNENYDFVARINLRSHYFSVMTNASEQNSLLPKSGKEADAATIRFAEEMTHPDDRELVLQNMRVDGIRCNLTARDRFQFTYRMVPPSGGIHYKKITQYYLDKERDIVVMTSEDVSEVVREEMRKNELLEAAFKAASEESRVKERETAAQLKAIMNNVDGGMSAATLIDGKIGYLYTNDEYYRMFGYSKEQFEQELPHGLMDIIHPEDSGTVLGAAENSVETRKERMEFRVHRRDGSLIWVRSISSTCTITGVDAPVHIAVLIDITKEREAADHLRMSEEQFRIAAAIGGRAIARYDIQTSTYHHHDEVLLAMGYGETVENVPEVFLAAGNIAPEYAAAYRDFYDQIRCGVRSCHLDSRIRMTDGSFRWCRQDATVIYDADDKPSQAIIVITDITEIRERETVYKKWQQSLEQRKPESYTLFRCNLSKDASLDAVEGSLLKIRFESEAVTFDDRTEEYVDQFVHPEDREKYRAMLRADTLLASYYRGERMKTLEYRELQHNDRFRWLKLSIELVEYPDSSDVEAYLMYEDIDESKRDELRNKALAETDPLTGVLNRTAFRQATENLMQETNAVKSLALLMLDIDGFKLINDTFGHATGDGVLIDIANLLGAALRQGDLLGRLGGDEFVICLRDMPDDTVIANKAMQICTLLHKALSLEVYVSTSVGIAVYPRDGKDFETLYRKMDTALYAVKERGKNGYAFYRDNQGDKQAAFAAGENTQTQATQKAKHRLLIVDDNSISVGLLARIFEEEYRIETASNGEDALQCMRRYGESIAAVLLDLVMPGMDGFEVLRQMRESTELAAIPVVVVSGMDEMENGLRSIRCGAADYVTKPVDPDLVRLRVHAVISKAENERLRARNSVLLMHNTEIAKYRAALESAHITVIEYEPAGGHFLYDPSISTYLAGRFDDRTLWDILSRDHAVTAETVEKLRARLEGIVSGDEHASDSMVVSLKTPSDGLHAFRVQMQKRINTPQLPDRVLLTLMDLGAE